MTSWPVEAVTAVMNRVNLMTSLNSDKSRTSRSIEMRTSAPFRSRKEKLYYFSALAYAIWKSF